MEPWWRPRSPAGIGLRACRTWQRRFGNSSPFLLNGAKWPPVPCLDRRPRIELGPRPGGKPLLWYLERWQSGRMHRTRNAA